MTTLLEYAASKFKKNPGVDAVERWNSRILPMNLQEKGISGAVQYIDIYGKTMGAPKTITLALQADAMGYHDMAKGFWQHAAKLEGVKIDIGEVYSVPDAPVSVQVAEKSALIEHFPPSMQPGRIVTMQPSDGALDRMMYVESHAYWGQRKRDGHKYVVFGTPEGVYCQSRSTKLKGSPSIEFSQVIREYAQENGAIILEGELYWLDCTGAEHKTAPQAMTANMEAGRGDPPIMMFMPFTALFAGDQDLRDETYAVRLLWAARITRRLIEIDRSRSRKDMFELCETFRTTEEKLALVRTQKSSGREGEIWFNPLRKYEGGKFRDDSIVRTKYLTETECIVTGLTPTTAAGRLFGAIEVTDLNGKSIGSVGTGFDRAMQAKILAEHSRHPGLVHISVISQGFSENGQMIHARLEEIL